MLRLLSLAALLYCNAAAAQEGHFFSLSGNFLQRACEEAPDASRPLIFGLVNSIEYMEYLNSEKLLYCPRPNVDPLQVVDIICRYVDENPSTRDRNATLLTYIALQEAFPCP